MMAILFILLLVSVILAWTGKRKLAIYLFIAILILSLIFFMHHITDHIDIQL